MARVRATSSACSSRSSTTSSTATATSSTHGADGARRARRRGGRAGAGAARRGPGGDTSVLAEIVAGLAARTARDAVKKRLDVLLVERGLAESRAQAQALVLAGLVPGLRRSRASRSTRRAELEVERPPPYVSRGGEKLAHALDALGVDPAGRDCLDVGASTGGFTDVLLQRGAARVIALDVGYGQLHPRLRDDPRVTVLERTNARDADASCRSRRSSSSATSRSSASGSRCRRCSRLAAPGLAGARARQAAVRGGPRGRRPAAASSATARCTRRVCARSPRRRSRWDAEAARRRRLGPARPEGKPRVLPPPRPDRDPQLPMSSTAGSTPHVG